MGDDPFDLLGDVLEGQFRVEAFVGEGDLSVVYKGHHVGVDVPVAIKCLNLPETLDPALTRPVVESFDEASRLHSRLARGSPHIARSVAAGRTVVPRTGATVPYQVREWFEGESLASQLARRRSQGSKGRSVEETIALLEPAVDGVAYAHGQGIAHLSLNPGNLFVAQAQDSCSLKVLDFGVARTIDRVASKLTAGSPLTSGLRLLRPAYAAPEQLDKEAGNPGTWTDVYALALIMMEVLSDRGQLQGSDTPGLVERALDDRSRPTPKAHGLKLPGSLDLVLTRAVARTSDSRQKDARTFWREVKTALRRPVSTAAQASQAASVVNVSSPPSLSGPPPVKQAVSAPSPQPGTARPTAILVGIAPPLPQMPRPAAPTPATTATLSAPIVADVQPAHTPAWAPSLAAPVLALPATSRTPLVVDSPEPGLVTARLSFRNLSFRKMWIVLGGAALVLAAVLSVFVALPRRRPTAAARAVPRVIVPTPPSAPAPSRAAVAPSAAPTPIAPSVVPSGTPPVVTHAEPARSARVAAPHTGRFSPAAARSALHAVSRKVARCRHARFWGNGYATVVFGGDGSVDHVLVDPPFSMTVAGRCVAEALSSARVPSFDGRSGFFRLRFYIAAR
jgi:serine/threonine-protein kinase